MAAIALTTDTQRADERRQRLRLRPGVRAAGRGARAAPATSRSAITHERHVAERGRGAAGGAGAGPADDRADRPRRRRVGGAGRRSTSTCRDESDARACRRCTRTLLHVICELVEAELSDDARTQTMPELRTETMTVNMGPQHPSTHGVLRLVLELDGETVVVGVADDRLPAHRHREDRRAEEVAAGDPARRADGLPERAVQQPGVLPVGREAARPRDARARAQHPRAARRAAADQQPPGLARHARHGSRRRVGDALLLPRARAAAEPQRDARRLPHVPELHARRRPARGSAARLPRRGHARSSIASRASSTSTRTC